MKIKKFLIFIFHGFCSLGAVLFIDIIYKLDFLEGLIILSGHWILLNQLKEMGE